MLKKGFNTSSYDLERLLLKGKNKKVTSLMKDEKDKKATDSEKCILKRKL